MTKKIFPYIFILFCAVILYSCNSAGDREYSSAKDLNSEASEAAAGLGLDSVNSKSRKIIHTADISCQVKDVLKVSMMLENYTKNLQGIVNESTLTNQQVHSREIPYSSDSLREIKSYQTSAFLRLRVPVKYRDSLINILPGVVSFVDSRQLLQTDASLSYLSNSLKTDAATVFTEKAETKATKSKDILVLADRTERTIDNVVEQYKINDAVAFATITINLYQPVQTFTSTIVNTEAAFRVPFSTSLSESLRNGLFLLQKLIAAVTTLWPVWMLLVLFFVGRNYWRKRILAVRKINPVVSSNI